MLFHVKSPINDDDALSFHQIPGQFLESLLVVVANVDLRKKIHVKSGAKIIILNVIVMTVIRKL